MSERNLRARNDPKARPIRIGTPWDSMDWDKVMAMFAASKRQSVAINAESENEIAVRAWLISAVLMAHLRAWWKLQ
jgi:hypothetical protein